MADKKAGGLEGVVALPSAVCRVDGVNGRLSYRGIDVPELSRRSTFEETAYLLWHGYLPDRHQLTDLEESFACCRELPPGITRIISTAGKEPSEPMEVLRTSISAMARFDPQGPVLRDQKADLDLAILLAAKVPVIVATFHRIRTGQEIIPPRDDLNSAANFLWMLTGEKPSEKKAKILDAALILHADHELNASTFAARVAASTLADIYAAVSAAMGALSGPLHGGANEDVMRMLERIGDPARAEQYVQNQLARGNKTPGFGHRVYKNQDPRGEALRPIVEELYSDPAQRPWLEMWQIVERVMREEKHHLRPNLDFFAALVYRALEIPSDLFTPVFACSRIVGWTAHILEQYANNRLIRPVADYIGPTDVEYVPMSERIIRAAA
jgi:citrate synthase